jgi:hypothetical protein
MQAELKNVKSALGAGRKDSQETKKRIETINGENESVKQGLSQMGRMWT